MNVIDLPRASARDPPLCDLPVSRRKCTIAPDGAAIAFSGDFAEAAHSLGRRGVCREEPRRGLHGAERVDDKQREINVEHSRKLIPYDFARFWEFHSPLRLAASRELP